MIESLLNKPALCLWLKTQNPDDTYLYESNLNCALAQFLSDHGFEPAEHFSVAGTCINVWEGNHEHKSCVHIPRSIEHALMQINRGRSERTFGRLLSLLEAGHATV
jgi:hypothetical protein